MLRMESVDSPSPRCYAQHQQNDGEPKDHKSTSKRQSHSTEIPCSLVQEVQHLEKRLNDQFAMRRALEKALGHKPCAINLSRDCYIPKPAEKLIKEIAVLELEVICLEQHLLTLYRQAFDQQLCSTVSACDMERRNRQSTRSFSGTLSETSAHDFSTPKKQQLVQSSRMVQARRSTTAALNTEPGISRHNDSKTIIGRSHSSLLPCSICSARVSPSANNLARALKPCHTSPLTFVEEGKCMDTSVVSLADILGTRIADHVPQTPNKISEDMIKCIAGIYIRLRDVSAVQRSFFPSPCSSFSSASGISSKFTGDIWSPRCRKESFIEAWQDSSFSSSDLGQQCDSVIEVSALCKGAQRSADVKDMLCKYKSLVQLLETVDLGGMKNEEKLAFWINVHNAMMMHAHVEYGIPQSNSKRMLLTKVSYIINGQRVNAELIEYQILCCRVHSSGQWFRLLLYPRWKPRDKDELQGFAVDRPEPLVHFALSSGSHSDPVVRLYSPKRVFQQLEAAKEEFIRGNVGVRGSGRGRSRVILPKVLESYARDAGLAAQELLRVVEPCLPEGLRAAVRQQGRPRGGGGGGVEWRPHNMAFRYALARELVAVGSPAGVPQAVTPLVARSHEP
ncbi:hypothetical protein CFC21_051410 [Triticum aestivum]|uniref:DUF547 domain-containing protein n=2 Tax=Triticum aestivum TaxID=4565 RepID=A0A3B6HQQ1_WHEAT|nr:uncharacterized protein LOC123085111 [Triticum aestivum]XP_044362638.1 uncharacterized protein LOC123085111 [Triticum aestivum]KAF7041643.1 hypothetical protein CFC21_051410 [Triticum aestivum]